VAVVSIDPPKVETADLKEGYDMLLTGRRFPHIGQARSLVRSGWWTALVVTLLTSVGIAQHGPGSSPADPPLPGQGPPPDAAPARRSHIRALPPAAQARISAALGEDEARYHVRARPGGYHMNNPHHGVTAEFTATHVSFRHGAHQWRISLRSYGQGDARRDARPTPPVGVANRVEYRRGPLTEWYVNGPLGLEQGFTLAEAARGAKGEPVTLSFALSGNLTPAVAADGRALTLLEDDTVALRYTRLTAWDADGRDLRAWLETAGHELRIRVDDRDARYPLTIDPYVEAPKLTTAKPCDPSGVCDDGAPGDEFGYSVSISADASTVVVGAPFKYTNSLARGAAYVFVKPPDASGGWNGGLGPNHFKTKLLASDGATNGLYLGWSVDISRDGGTIVAGARGFTSPGPSGAAYVFVRPANGWGHSAVQTHTAKLSAFSTIRNESVGNSVAISGDGGTIATGAPNHRIGSTMAGAVYMFLRPPTGWVNATESQEILGTSGSYYGDSVALSDNASTLVVGASGVNPHGDEPIEIGAGYVLTRKANPGSADSYGPVIRLIPSDGAQYDIFGWSVSTNAVGSVIVVGAPGDSSDSSPTQGAAYVYVRPANGWGVPGSSIIETAQLSASDGGPGDGVGVSVDISLDGNTIVAGSFRKQSPTAAYFFVKPASGWATSTEATKVISSDVAAGEWFAWSTSLSGTGGVAIIGTPRKTIDGANLRQGAVYVFTGSAAAPRASVSPSSLTFATQSVGTTSSPKSVTVTNTGSAPLNIASVATAGPFSTSQQCVAASPIPPGGTCTESVRFAPLSLGFLTGTLTFTDDSGGTPGAIQQVPLHGTGQKANTFTTITSVSSNRVLVGHSVDVFFSVTSEPGSTIYPSGPVFVHASTGESCASGQSDAGYCTLTFLTAQDRTITASYSGNAILNASTSASVPVKVFSFTVSVSPSSQSVTGKKATYTLNVATVNGNGVTLSAACNGGPINTTCAMSPTSMTVVGSTATSKATFTVPTGASSGTYTVKVAATFAGTTRSATATLIVK
jgi:hypothetical protein